MKLSTRSRYGTRMMLEIALSYDKGRIMLKDVSNNLGISFKYLGQLVIPLKAAGLIDSVQGAGGGYFLSKPPSEIRLSDIVVAVEGPLDLVGCIKNEKVCNKTTECITRKIWEELSERCYRFLNSISLKDMVGFYKKEKDIDYIIKKV